MKTIAALDKWFIRILKIIIAIFMIALTLIIVVQVFARYVFKFSIGSFSDMPPYLMIFIIWLAAIVAAKKDDHIKIELLDMFVKNQRIIQGIRCVLLLLSAAAMAYFSYYALLWTMDAFKYNNIDPGLRICLGYLYGVIPFSGFFMAVYYVINFITGVGKLCQR